MNARLADVLDHCAEEAEVARNAPPLGIYVIEEEGGMHCKVGVTSDPEQRLANLRLGNPRKMHLRMFQPVPNPRRTEHAAHSQLWRKHICSEWFAVSAPEALLAVEAALKVVEGQSDSDFTYEPLAGGWSPNHAKFDAEAGHVIARRIEDEAA